MTKDAASGIQPQDASLRQLLQRLKPHDHLCLFYQSPQERLEVAVPFIAIGLERGEKCIYLVDTSTPDDIRKQLTAEGINVAKAENSGQLVIHHHSESYGKLASFEIDRLLTPLLKDAQKAVSDGYPALRCTAESEWLLDTHPEISKLMEYEARLTTDILATSPCLVLCQYNLHKFDSEILKVGLFTHPLIIKGGKIYDNLYYIPPEKVLSGEISWLEFDHWLNALERERQWQASLRQSEQRYRTLTEQSLIGVLAVAKGFRIVYANPAIAEITGYNVEELLSLPPEKVQALVHPEDRALVWGRFQQRLASGDVPPHYEYCGIRKDGKVRWLEMHAAAIEYGGEPAVLAAIRDITEHKRLEKQLRESENRYRCLFEASLDGILILDGETGELIDANPFILNKLRYGLVELRGKHLWELGFFEDIELSKAAFKELKEKGYVRYEHLPLRTRDGQRIYVEFVSNAYEVEGQKFFQCNIRDITERKRLDEALKASEQEKSIVLNTVAELIVRQDLQHKVLWANRAAAQSVNLNPEELVGRHCYEIWHGRSTPCVNCPVAKARDTGEPQEGEMSTPDGRMWLIHGYPVKDASGKVVELIEVTANITERKRTQEMYETILRTAMDGFFLTDMEGRFLEVNDTYCRFTGYSREELLKMSISDVEAIETQEETARHIQKIREAGHDRFESRHRCKDGRLVDVEISINYLPRDSGRMVVFIHDITERKRAMEAIRLSEERYRSVVENANEAISVVQNGVIKFANAKVTEITGYTVEELNAMPAEVVIHPDDRERVVKYHSQRMQGEQAAVSYEFRIIDKWGKIRWLERHAASITWEGQPASLVLDTDVTEREQAGKALQKSEARYRLIAENTRDVIITTGMDLNVTYISPSIKYLGDRSPEEVLATPVDKLLTPASLQEATKVLREELERAKTQPTEPGRSRTLELEVIRKDGSTLWAEARVNFLRNVEGQSIGLIGVLRDITERKKAEAERKKLELKAQVSSRLAAVGEMAAGVAHEINNPLTGIVGYAQLLASREDLPEEVKKDLKVINDGAQRVAGIVQRLLTFARQIKPERRQVNVNQLIESTLVLRAYSLRTSNIEVITKLDPYLPDTIADPGQIQQVLLNLIINAETAMKEVRRKHRLTISTRCTDNIIEIRVKDNGPGIKPEIMDRIFDPFFTTRPAGEGTGLGLSLCYGIVSEHKGRIYAESKPGRGAAFVVELPVVTEVSQPMQPPIDLKANLAGSKILVVDDEPVIREFINQVLSEEGCEVDAVATAEEALQKITSQQYNLLLLDIKMPGMDGVELYNRIKRLERQLARRVMVITGDIISYDTERFLARNKLSYIEKPFTATQLIDRLGRALGTGR